MCCIYCNQGSKFKPLREQSSQRRKLVDRNPKPEGTFRKKGPINETQKPITTKREKRAAFCAVSKEINAQPERLGDKQFIRQKLSVQHPKPRGTFQKQPSKKTNSTGKNKKRKTGSISCCFSTQTPKTQPRKITQYSSTAPSHLTRRERCKTLRARKNNARPRWKT